MKNSYTQKIKLTVAAFTLCITGAVAQQISDFGNLFLSPNSYNDGASGSGNFTSGNVEYHNTYNSAWMYWDSGFAYSNQGDTAVNPSDYVTQTYQTKAGTDHSSMASGSGPNVFGIGQQNARISTVFPGHAVTGMYVTNTTYAYNSMALGDSFGKKFGDTSSTHSAVGVNEGFPDWFKLTVIGYYGGVVNADTVNFYLADFRFTNNAQDYIVKDWQYVDLTSIGDADSLEFILTSSDNGSFGMNTPSYFCIDDLFTNDYVTGVSTITDPSGISLYPNPFENVISVDFKNTNKRLINVYNAFGALVSKSETNDQKLELNLNGFDAGIYFVNVIEDGKSSTIRVIKK